MDHLKELLDAQAALEAKNPRKAKVTRKIIIAEGICQNTGTIAQLKTMIEFKYKYKVRVFLDESNSFGVLGETGKGLTEHLNVRTFPKAVKFMNCRLIFKKSSVL